MGHHWFMINPNCPQGRR